MNKTSKEFEGDNRLLLGIILGVITFWLFAQSLVNLVVPLQTSFKSDIGTINIAVSLTALMSGLFIVGAGDFADKYGRVKVAYIGLILNIIGSLLIIITPLIPFLIAGRIFQGLSAACIMPATLAIINEYYIGTARQRALSYWSIGSWGGSGICTLFGGLMSTHFGWRTIFIVSIVLTLLSMYLIKHTPETKAEPVITKNGEAKKFDIVGLIILIICMLSINVIITQSSKLGLFSPIIISLIVVFFVSLIGFIMYENKIKYPLVDFSLFANKGYSGATVSNFMLNGVAGGTLIVVNTYYQQQLDFNESQTGVISLTYLIAVLIMIRVGEKILQALGPKRPLLMGSGITAIGLVLLSLTFLPEPWYITSSVIGYLLFGTGLGIYATPSTDTAVAQAPDDKVGVASGVYKMASSLGNAFGVAISGTIYGTFASQMNMALGGFMGVVLNAVIALIAFFAILLLVPKKQTNL
ncbi:MFS transporter, DHA2 family, multidrug resistance protein [Staphylococcus pasteuri]|uniref:Quinolone resistance protein NorB n=2 Tax=Staphylococcus TaxID=1279 RepID=A0ABY1H5W5_9STAP|nr:MULTISPECIES: MFS transporter [Staphylococcus]ATH61858.1 quinolone resistance protein [Staphylococcus pasteuri]KKI56163.1 putative transporter [Staphylococcus pasteuri]MCF7600033.1 MFS transporter [Staphylococcus pasteuri]MDI3231777.1 MFS transporter [Staphylococcus pasteuri]MDO6572627.1 MFS transporter [Staphylococcus pasteuri_A]